MTPRFALAALRRHLLVALLTAVAVAVAGVALGMSWPKTYTAHATILLGLDIKGSNTDPQTASLYLKDRVATYAELVSADDVIIPVAKAADIAPEQLREQVVVSIVPETVVLDVSVSGASPEQAVELTSAISSSFRSQVSSLNVKTGGPKILPAELSSPRPASTPDQLHGSTLVAVAALAGLLAGVLAALVLALIKATRSGARSTESATAEPSPPTDPAQPVSVNGRGGRKDEASAARVPIWN